MNKAELNKPPRKPAPTEIEEASILAASRIASAAIVKRVSK